MASGLLEALGLPKRGAPPSGAQGVPPANAQGLPPPPANTPPPPGGAATAADDWTPDSDAKPPYIGPGSPEMRAILLKGIREGAEKDKKDAEQALVKIYKQLSDVKAYVAGLPADALSKSSYAQVMTDVRKRFPEAAGLSQWVKVTAIKVPEMKGKLPSPKALMAVVERAINDRGAQLGWSMSTGKDMTTLNTDRLLAAYMSELPPGVSVKISNGVVQLTLEGAAPSVKAAGGGVDPAADKGGARVALKNDDFGIQVSKSGVVVTTSFEQALDETKAAIKVMRSGGKTEAAAEFEKKADDLTVKLKLVHKTKDVKLAAELEKSLKEVRGRIEAEFEKGPATITGGASVSEAGEVGGKVQIEIALQAGRTFTSEGAKLSFTANVSTKGYKFEVAFSMGEPVETASLQDLFSDADRQIRELYKLAGDKGVRSIEDATALNAKLQEVMAPVKASADKAKTLRKKSDIAASFGFSIEGEWPAAGKAPPPAAMFSVKIAF